jgi:hypothetical protein
LGFVLVEKHTAPHQLSHRQRPPTNSLLLGSLLLGSLLLGSLARSYPYDSLRVALSEIQNINHSQYVLFINLYLLQPHILS